MADPKAVTGRNNFLNRGPVYQCQLCTIDDLPYQGDHSQLVKHVVRDHLNESEVPYGCGKCKRRFLKESELTEHLKDKHQNDRSLMTGTRLPFALRTGDIKVLSKEASINHYATRCRPSYTRKQSAAKPKAGEKPDALNECLKDPGLRQKLVYLLNAESPSLSPSSSGASGKRSRVTESAERKSKAAKIMSKLEEDLDVSSSDSENEVTLHPKKSEYKELLSVPGSSHKIDSSTPVAVQQDLIIEEPVVISPRREVSSVSCVSTGVQVSSTPMIYSIIENAVKSAVETMSNTMVEAVRSSDANGETATSQEVRLLREEITSFRKEMGAIREFSSTVKQSMNNLTKATERLTHQFTCHQQNNKAILNALMDEHRSLGRQMQAQASAFHVMQSKLTGIVEKKQRSTTARPLQNITNIDQQYGMKEMEEMSRKVRQEIDADPHLSKLFS